MSLPNSICADAVVKGCCLPSWTETRISVRASRIIESQLCVLIPLNSFLKDQDAALGRWKLTITLLIGDTLYRRTSEIVRTPLRGSGEIPILIAATVGLSARFVVPDVKSRSRDAHKTLNSRAQTIHNHAAAVQSDSCRAKGYQPPILPRTQSIYYAQGTHRFLRRVQGACDWCVHDLVRIFGCFTSRFEQVIAGICHSRDPQPSARCFGTMIK